MKDSISKVLTDSDISHDEFVSRNNLLKEFLWDKRGNQKF